MPCEELADERVPVAGGSGFIPALDRLVSMQRNEEGEPRGKRRRVGQVVRVLVLQERDAERASACRCEYTRAVRIAASNASGTWTVPILLLSDST